MKTLLKLTICAIFICLVGLGSAQAQEDPNTLVKQKVNEIMDMLGKANADGKTEAQKTEMLKGVILPVFDLTEMSKRALGINYGKFSPEQQKAFETEFAEMLEDIYLGNLATYTDQKVVFGKTTTLKPNEAVEIFSEIIFSDGTKMPISYRISNKSGQWLVYDVIIEGISFIKNYRDQFKELLTKNSPAQLLDIMRQKNAEK